MQHVAYSCHLVSCTPFLATQIYIVICEKYMNTYLKYQPALIQFFTFLALAAGCISLYWIVSGYLFPGLSAIYSDKTEIITQQMIVQSRWAQVVSAFFTFILPALLFGYFSDPKPLNYVGIRSRVSPLLLALSLILLIVAQPTVSWLGQFNEKIDFGSFQKSMKDAEAVYARAMQMFLQMKSPTDLFINIFVMALLPAVGEELFFRGALQKSLLRLSHLPVMAVLISSAVFALLHGTAFHVLPIFTLGILLGTIYHITQNLWYTIIIHFSNNALAVLASYYSSRNETLKKIANDDLSYPLISMLISLILVVGVIYFIKQKSKQTQSLYVYDEVNENAL
jgi:uncharacterized protein